MSSQQETNTQRQEPSASSKGNTTQNQEDGIRNCAMSIAKSLTSVVMASEDYAQTLQQMELLDVQDAQELERALTELIYGSLVAKSPNTETTVKSPTLTSENSQNQSPQKQTSAAAQPGSDNIPDEGNTIQDSTYPTNSFGDWFENLEGDNFLE